MFCRHDWVYWRDGLGRRGRSCFKCCKKQTSRIFYFTFERKIMTQSKKGSVMESLTNIAIGITVGFVSNIIVLPAFGYDVTLQDATAISLVFTVISFVRSFIVRRIYNKYNFWGKE